MEIFWIDDTPSRHQVAEILADAIGCKINFVNVNKRDIEPIIIDILESNVPDLFILDHSLNLATSATIRTGSTLALMIRDKHPTCPIICVTAGSKENSIDTRHRDAYELIIEDDKISSYYSHVKAIVKTFESLNKNNFDSLGQLISLLGGTDEDNERISKIMPIGLKTDFNNTSLLLDYYRWIHYTLIQRPGFLLDKLWVATLIGLTEEAFSSVEEMFDPALYRGPFSNDDEKRWWKSKVLEVLGDVVEETGLPWMLGRHLVKDTPEAYPRCHASGEEFPDTVAYVDPTEDAMRVPIKRKYTVDHPSYDEAIFFESILIMKGA